MANDVKEVGQIVWVDLTIPNAEKVVQEFYRSVIGWETNAFNMGDYNDYVVATPQGKETVAGICHARGANASLPPSWIVYIKVKSLDESMAVAKANGGEVLTAPKEFGGARFCLLKDPAGAVFAVMEGDAGS
ncbi:VOC family protein [Bradyrhizobium liaoningense]|uniref:VOC family protein n=1 Tax=Bradyrhizobium liaoningense TaxID=43992 RepID=UPI001BA9F8DD|nr:VOC family protein [Bradyrhizobium liaoningense]MBR1031490.1 VOC family protein [Bradyrhizobium liaoningense]